jgi:hypothetical protein
MPIKYDTTGSGQSADTVTDPQKLFQALPAKAKNMPIFATCKAMCLANGMHPPRNAMRL